jgi:hypothetical protein
MLPSFVASSRFHHVGLHDVCFPPPSLAPALLLCTSFSPSCFTAFLLLCSHVAVNNYSHALYLVLLFSFFSLSFPLLNKVAEVCRAAVTSLFPALVVPSPLSRPCPLHNFVIVRGRLSSLLIFLLYCDLCARSLFTSAGEATRSFFFFLPSSLPHIHQRERHITALYHLCLPRNPPNLYAFSCFCFLRAFAAHRKFSFPPPSFFKF